MGVPVSYAVTKTAASATLGALAARPRPAAKRLPQVLPLAARRHKVPHQVVRRRPFGPRGYVPVLQVRRIV